MNTINLQQNHLDAGWKHRTTAFKNGYLARVDGFSRAAQPHGNNTISKSHWNLGWHKADKDMKIVS